MSRIVRPSPHSQRSGHRWIGSLDKFGSPDVVVLDTSPQGVLEIIGDRLPGRVRRQLGRYKYGPAVRKVAFAGDVPWTNEHARRPSHCAQ